MPEVSLANHDTLPFDLAFHEVRVTIIMDRQLLASSYNYGLAASINIFSFKG